MCWWWSLVLVLSVAPSVWGFTYHAAPTGVESRTCEQAKTVTTPVQTINKALTCATAPGDIVQLASGTFPQRADLNLAADGTAAGGYITLQGQSDGSTILNGSTLGNGWMVYGRHLKYIKVKFLNIGPYTGGGIGMFGHSDHVEITDNTLHDSTFAASMGSAIRVTTKYSLSTNTVQGPEIGTATYVIVARNTMLHIRTGFMGTLPNSGSETLTLAYDITNFLVEDNSIEDGQFIGIDILGKTRNSTDITGNNPTLPIPPEPWPRKGIVRKNTVKNMRKGYGAADVGIYCDGCEDVVFERNLVDDAPGYCYAISAEEAAFITQQVIIRQNVARECSSAMMMMAPPTISGHHATSNHLRVVHNTGIKTKEFGPVWKYFWGNDTVFRNNIGKVTTTASVPYSAHIAEVASTSPQINYNIYHGDPTPFWEYKGVGYTTFAAYKTGSLQDTNGKFEDPLINTTTGALLAGSPAIDQGGFLTTVQVAGGGPSGPCAAPVPVTTLSVVDARYFTDGYGMSAGDTIRIGAMTAQVLGVNYDTNQLTLNASMAGVTAGTQVSYAYTGAAPDIGACEYGASTCP